MSNTMKALTLEQLREVNQAAEQEYTVMEVYWKVANKDWTVDMFESFISRIENEQRKATRRLFL